LDGEGEFTLDYDEKAIDTASAVLIAPDVKEKIHLSDKTLIIDSLPIGSGPACVQFNLL
jgi:hypothetical protein